MLCLQNWKTETGEDTVNSPKKLDKRPSWPVKQLKKWIISWSLSLSTNLAITCKTLKLPFLPVRGICVGSTPEPNMESGMPNVVIRQEEGEKSPEKY